MRRLFSNLVVISLGLLGAIAKWGGLVMDVIGLPEAGSQLDNWISQLEIGDGAYILIVVSVILLLIINGPALRRAFLKPKARTYGIEEIREFSGILSPRNEVGRQGWNKVEMGTFHIGQNEEETLQPVTTNQDPLEVDCRKTKCFVNIRGRTGLDVSGRRTLRVTKT